MKLPTDPKECQNKNIHIEGNVTLGKNVCIDFNTLLRGNIVLGDNVKIGANCVLKDVKIAADVIIKDFCSIESASIKKQAIIGPYARIRPNTIIGSNTQIGNFVEVKSAKIGSHCKINHHSFIGDTEIKDNVIIGAGCITCNHDGSKTQKTVIHECAYIGSGVNLIAPITIGAHSFIGAGSTLTENVPANKLAIARKRQEVIADWK